MHSGDNESGEVKKDGEDAEKVFVNLGQLQNTAKFVIFTTTIYSPPGASFAQLSDAYCRVLDSSNNRAMCKYNLSNVGSANAVVFAKLYFQDGGWFIMPLGHPAQGANAQALEPLVKQFATPIERKPQSVRVTVVSGTNLPALDSGKTSDPYVVVSLGNEKKKTPVIKKTLNPVWDNATFTL